MEGREKWEILGRFCDWLHVLKRQDFGPSLVGIGAGIRYGCWVLRDGTRSPFSLDLQYEMVTGRRQLGSML
jgi:hypothetical protein